MKLQEKEVAYSHSNKNTKTPKVVWVIMTNHSSCMVNAVCLNYKYALNWVEKENKKYSFEMYFIEQSQLLNNREMKE